MKKDDNSMRVWVQLVVPLALVFLTFVEAGEDKWSTDAISEKEEIRADLLEKLQLIRQSEADPLKRRQEFENFEAENAELKDQLRTIESLPEDAKLNTKILFPAFVSQEEELANGIKDVRNMSKANPTLRRELMEEFETLNAELLEQIESEDAEALKARDVRASSVMREEESDENADQLEFQITKSLREIDLKTDDPVARRLQYERFELLNGELLESLETKISDQNHENTDESISH